MRRTLAKLLTALPASRTLLNKCQPLALTCGGKLNIRRGKNASKTIKESA
jgi:hypothetical protein